MAAHSTLLGGSIADRLLNCPGSYQSILALPASADVPSIYASEGTMLHNIMKLVTDDERAHDLAGTPREFDVSNDDDWAAELLGTQYEVDGSNIVFTEEHVTLVQTASEMRDRLEEEFGGGFKIVGTEMRVRFPGVPSSFGTLDLALASATHIILIDWKFGGGIPVSAIYTDPDGGERVNPQLMYYLTAAMKTHPKMFGKRKLVVAIIQPRMDDPCTYTEVTRKEVKMFQEDIEDAVGDALSRDPPLHKGEHCRFCPAKVSCPKWTAPLLDLSAIGGPPMVPQDPVTAPRDNAYGVYLAKVKVLLDTAALMKTEVDAQLHAFLSAGGSVPGWKLKLKTKMRQWVEEQKVHDMLSALGFSPDEIWQYKLVTFASADATAKRLGVKIPAELRVAPPTSETTIAAIDDPAAAVEPRVAIEQFRESLNKLTREQGKPTLPRIAGKPAI